MSFLENAESFEIAHLPPDDQLRMHVEGDNFKYCLDNDVDALWSEAQASISEEAATAG